MKPNQFSKAGFAIVLIAVLLIAATLNLIWNSTKQLAGLPPSRAMMEFGYGESAGGVAATDMAVAPGMPMTVEGKAMMYPEPVPPMGSGATPEQRQAVGPKIIRTGSLMMRVDDAGKQLEALKQIADRAGGFTSNANLSDNGGVKTAYATIRVPSDKYQETVAEVKKLATLVLSEQESGDDVTAQYVDLDARLKAAQAEEQQYLQILKQAKTIEDTLAVTERLAEVRSRIEQMQGQMRLLQDQTSYATLTVTLTEDTRVQVPTQTWAPFETFRAAVRALVVSLQGLADALIAGGVFLIGLVVPVFALVALVAWLILKAWKRFMK